MDIRWLEIECISLHIGPRRSLTRSLILFQEIPYLFHYEQQFKSHFHYWKNEKHAENKQLRNTYSFTGVSSISSPKMSYPTMYFQNTILNMRPWSKNNFKII